MILWLNITASYQLGQNFCLAYPKCCLMAYSVSFYYFDFISSLILLSMS